MEGVVHFLESIAERNVSSNHAVQDINDASDLI